MPRGYQQLIINNSSDLPGADQVESFSPGVDASTRGGPPPQFADDTQAARYYLARIVPRSNQPAVRSLSPEAAPTQVSDTPELASKQVRQLALTETTLVDFEQTKSSVPVFGARTVVELDQDRNLVSASVNVAEVEQIPTQPDLPADSAAEKLRSFVVPYDELELPDPALVILPLPEGQRLAWQFKTVHAAPPEPDNMPPVDKSVAGGCCDVHAADLPPVYDYFVDAIDGEILFYFSRQSRVDVPTWCQGQDEDGTVQTFFGRSTAAGYELNNNFEDILTFDMQENLIEWTPVPASPVRNPSNHWQGTATAAVSAHVNAARVMDFLFSILRRDSIDDSGQPLENIVNCVSQDVPQADRPEWINAVWWQGKMWYGQKSDGNGGFQSLARFLDIIGHELFHGVTESTANLIYRDLSGALNESFSDIFGVIIRNWYLAPDRLDTSTWDWQIGAGLGSGGDPMRDLSHPASVGSWWVRDNNSTSGWRQITGYPDHMNQYVALPYDHGGVHIFSNIHNRAAHGLLTSTLAGTSTPALTVQEVAVLYYLTLTRLTAVSDFSDARAELLNVAATLYGGSTARLQEVNTAITTAYDAVGIT